MPVSLRVVLDEAESSLYADLPRAALALCRLALQNYPRCLRAYTVMAASLWAVGDPGDAVRTLRSVLVADPEDVTARYLLALALEDTDLTGAITEMETAFARAPWDPDIRQALGRLYLVRDRVPRPVETRRDALARVYARGGLWDRVLAEAADLLVSQPNRLDLQMLLLEAEWRTGHHDEAAALCQGILLDNPLCLKANLILSHIWQAAGKSEAGQAFFERAEEMDPEHRMARQLFGSAGASMPYPARKAMVELEAPAEEEGLGEGEFELPSDLQPPLPMADVDGQDAGAADGSVEAAAASTLPVEPGAEPAAPAAEEPETSATASPPTPDGIVPGEPVPASI